MTTVRVDGLKELGLAMKTLGDDVSKKIARAAANAAAQVVKKSAIAKAPRDTGNLARNIIVKRIPPGESDLTSEYIVTVRHGKLTKKQRGGGLTDAFYGRFLEFGTVKMQARPFLRPAFDENRQRALDAMVSRLKARIAKGK